MLSQTSNLEQDTLAVTAALLDGKASIVAANLAQTAIRGSKPCYVVTMARAEESITNLRVETNFANACASLRAKLCPDADIRLIQQLFEQKEAAKAALDFLYSINPNLNEAVSEVKRRIDFKDKEIARKEYNSALDIIDDVTRET